MSGDDWERLGRTVAARRLALGLSQEALVTRGGPSHQTVRNVERGMECRPMTLANLDRALDWRAGTAARALAGTATEEEIMPAGGPGGAPSLADAVRRGRLAKRLPVDLTRYGGPSEMTVRKIEAAAPGEVAPQTLRKLDRVLDWRPGTAARCLAGTVTEGEIMGSADNAETEPPTDDRPVRGRETTDRIDGLITRLRGDTLSGRVAAIDGYRLELEAERFRSRLLSEEASREVRIDPKLLAELTAIPEL